MAKESFTHSQLKEWASENFVIGQTKVDGENVDVTLTSKQADEFIKSLFGKIAEEVANGKDVKLMGLGTVKRVLRNERVGRNPQNREETIVIPARYAIKLDAEKSMKDKLKALEVVPEE